MSLLKQLLSKMSLAALLALFAGIFSYRASSNKHHREQAEQQNDEYQQIIEDIEQARNINNAVDALPDAAVDQQLHDNDWYRD